MCNVSSPRLSSYKGHSKFGQSFLGVCALVVVRGPETKGLVLVPLIKQRDKLNSFTSCKLWP